MKKSIGTIRNYTYIREYVIIEDNKDIPQIYTIDDILSHLEQKAEDGCATRIHTSVSGSA